jgi:MFS family permease
VSILEGCVSTMHGALIGGGLITAYAYGLGATDFHIGLIGGLTTLANAGLLLGAGASVRLGARKPVVFRAGLASRLSWSLLAVIPFLPLPPIARVWMFLGVLGFAHLLQQVAGSPWMSWMADLVPEAERGRYFSVRNSVCGAVGMVCALTVGRAFDHLRATATWAQGLGAFVPFFSLAAVFAVGSAALYTRQWEPPMRGETARRPHHMLRMAFRHPAFRPLLRFQILWAVACGIGGPFFGAHMIKNLQMTMSQIALYGILAGLAALAAQPVWGRLADRFGNRPVLAFNIFMVFLSPFIWLFATPTFHLPVWIDGLFSGLFWPGVNLTLFNLVISTAPEENRQSYLATNGVISGLGHFAAAALGGRIALYLGDLAFPLGAQVFVNFHVLFVLSALIRIALLPSALRLHEPRAQPLRAMISGLVDARSRWGAMIFAGIEQGISFVRAGPARRGARPRGGAEGGDPPVTP